MFPGTVRRCLERARLLGIAVGVLLCLGIWHGALAQGSDKDAAEIRAYMPSDAKFKAFLGATQAAQAAASRDPSLRAEAAQVGKEQTDGSLAQWQQIFSRHPRYFAFFKSAGLSEHEAAILNNLVPWMLQYIEQPQQVAAMGLMSKAQLAFADAHKSELQKLLQQIDAQIKSSLSGARSGD